MLTDWLTQTKFIPPHLREDYVPRNRLLDALHTAARAHTLTLLSAPPGYGKTTLLAALPLLFPNLTVAWISLDEEDNDLARFLAVLVGALQRLNPAFGANTQALLSSLANPADESRRVIVALINETLEKLPEVWVVLDDLHLITEPAVYACLDYLLARIPPQMHLVVATRYDPPLALARLRARGQLAELRIPDLRFTTAEAGLFLNNKQCLGLSPEDLDRLQSRAEGWAAGLRLLAASLDRMPSPGDRAAFIHGLESTNRYVFDFLAEEVLMRQEPDIRLFLFETSILSELTQQLCAAVTGRGDAQAVLDDLYHRNLFLVQVDQSGKTYRYHALFAQFLKEQLEREAPGRMVELHCRAAEARRLTAPARAIGHYLAAGSWAQAAQTIEEVSETLVRQGQLRTLRGWIEGLPASLREARPRLQYLQGIFALQVGDWNHAMHYLMGALRGYEAVGDQAGQGEVLLEMINCANQQHDYPRQKEYVEQAFSLPLPVYGQVQLLVARTWQMIYQGDSQQADDDLGRALELTLASNDLRAFNVIAPLVNMQAAFLPGGPGRLERYCRQVLSRVKDGTGPIQIGAHSLLSYLLFLGGSLEEAAREAEQARAISQQIGGYAYTEAQIHYVLGILMAIRGDYGGMERFWTSFLPWIEQTPSLRPFLVPVHYFIGRMQWMQHKWEHAREADRSIATIIDPGEYPEAAVCRRLMHAMIDITDRRFVEAEQTLREAISIEHQWPHSALFGSPRMLLAYLSLQRGREKEAWSQFDPLLTECEQRSLPGLILQETALAPPLLHLAIERKIHTAFAKNLIEGLGTAGEPRPVTVPDTGQTLTLREVEVLKLIVSGASNQAIANQLVISEHTVKVHITNVYAKLGVASRTQAVARAREIGLA